MFKNIANNIEIFFPLSFASSKSTAPDDYKVLNKCLLNQIKILRNCHSRNVCIDEFGVWLGHYWINIILYWYRIELVTITIWKHNQNSTNNWTKASKQQEGKETVTKPMYITGNVQESLVFSFFLHLQFSVKRRDLFYYEISGTSERVATVALCWAMLEPEMKGKIGILILTF